MLCCRWKLIKLGHWARAGQRVRLQYNVRWAAPEVVAADLDGVRAICLQACLQQSDADCCLAVGQGEHLRRVPCMGPQKDVYTWQFAALHAS